VSNHFIQLYFDNDGYVDGEFICSNDECEICDPILPTWDKFKFEMVRTEERVEIGRFNIDITKDDNGPWLNILGYEPPDEQ
jgi:hypothetical protein